MLTSETSVFQQVPIFEHNNIDDIIINDSVNDETDEPLEIHDDKSFNLHLPVPQNTLAYHQLPGAKTVTIYNKFKSTNITTFRCKHSTTIKHFM